jgi:hypothetical protein
MPSYKTRDLSIQPNVTIPPLAPVRGGSLGKADRLNSVLADQDRVLGHGRRVIATVGLHGSSEFMVVDTDPDTTSTTATYPTHGFKQIVARSRVTLTPGHMPVVVVTALPSGPRQILFIETGWWVGDGAGGAVEVEFTWDNGTTTATQTVTLQIPASGHEFFAQPQEAGEGWKEVYSETVGPVMPDGFDSQLVEREKWVEGVTLDIIIRYVDSPRVLDCAVFEAPALYARKRDDDGTFTTPCHTSGTGAPLAAYPSPYPVQRLSEAAGGDCTGGTLQALDVTVRQAHKLGPCFVAWSAHNEATALPTNTEAIPRSFTSTQLLDFFDSVNINSWVTTRRSWSGSSGATARRHNTAGEHQVLRGVAGCAEIIVRAYCRVSGTTGRLIVYAGPECRLEIRTTSVSYAWVTARTALRCGVAADDPSTWQAFGAVLASGGGNTFDVLDLVIEYSAIE